jgi:hypothetical protein
VRAALNEAELGEGDTSMLADSVGFDPGLLAVYGLIGGSIVTVIVSRSYYHKTFRDIREQGSALSLQNSHLQEQQAEMRAFVGDVLSHHEDRVKEISDRTHVDKSVVRQVVNALSDELLDPFVRAAMLEVQDAQGKVNSQRLFKTIAEGAPPGTVAQSRRILNEMRDRGEIEFDGALSSTETIQVVQTEKAREHQR